MAIAAGNEIVAGEREPDEHLADVLREQPEPCSCRNGCVIKGKGISAPAGCYCIAGWEGWRY